jgi:hypothetical protein
MPVLLLHCGVEEKEKEDRNESEEDQYREEQKRGGELERKEEEPYTFFLTRAARSPLGKPCRDDKAKKIQWNSQEKKGRKRRREQVLQGNLNRPLFGPSPRSHLHTPAI